MPLPDVLLWFCGYCHHGPMSSVLENHCVSCGRRKDKYARYEDHKSSAPGTSSRSTRRPNPPPTNTTIPQAKVQSYTYAGPTPLPLRGSSGDIISQSIWCPNPPPTNTTIPQAKVQPNVYVGPPLLPLMDPSEDISPRYRNLAVAPPILHYAPQVPRGARADPGRKGRAEGPFRYRGHRQEEIVDPNSRELDKDIDKAKLIKSASSRLAVETKQASAFETIGEFISEEATLESADREKVTPFVAGPIIENNSNDSFRTTETVAGGTNSNQLEHLSSYNKALEDLFPQAYNLPIESEPPQSNKWTDPDKTTSNGTTKRTLEDTADVNEPEGSIFRICQQSHQRREDSSYARRAFFIWVPLWAIAIYVSPVSLLALVALRSNDLKQGWNWLRRPPAGHQRITWNCGCGKPMSADVEETYVGAASQLEKELRNAAASAAQTTSKRPDPGSSPPSSTGGPVREQVANLTTDRRTPKHQSQTQQQATNQELGPRIGISPGDAQVLTQATTLDRFLLLCIKGSRLMELEQIEIIRDGDDQVMFQDIRRAYLKIRQQQATDFHPDTPELVRKLSRSLHHLKRRSQRLVVRAFTSLRLGWLVWWIGDNVFYIPTSANFVRFELIPIKTRLCPEVLSSPALPPESEVRRGNYHYVPCPQDVQNPLLRIPYLHVLFEPGHHLNQFWTNRTPKKLNARIEYGAGAGVEPIIGWGIHLVEGPNWMAFSLVSEMVLVLSLVGALAYAVWCGDVSAGFTMGQYVVSVLAVSNGLGMVFLSQSG